MTELEDISKIINWYFKESSKCQDINILLASRDKLSVLSFRLAEITANEKRDYNLSYFKRKIEVCRSTQQMINAKMKFNQAENKALLDNEGFYKDEILKEALAYKMDVLLRQCNKILEAMNQRIAHLKDEFKRKNNQPG